MKPRSLYDELARTAKALANPERLRLVELLSQGPRTVEVLAERAAQPLATTSHHLQKLAAAGLVERERQGRHIVYSLADRSVAEFWAALRRFGEAHSGELREAVRELRASREQSGVISPDELSRLLARGKVTLIDVRPEEEYAAGHLPGALSLPLATLAKRLGELPKRKLVVAYCRSPYCQLADRAVEILRRRGFDARRLEEGIQEWSARGRQVEPAALQH
ncbi:MAG: metalloregulator ArsR/SmtB family transcription factor [Polyangiaceae bacterium]